MDNYLNKIELANRDIRLFRKILSLVNPLPYPGELQNVIKTSVAFSDPANGFDYLRRLYVTLVGKAPNDPKVLQNQGFTVREIGQLMSQSKSGVGRLLQGEGKK